MKGQATDVQYFRDVAEIIAAGGPPDRAKLVQVMARYGLKPVAPPQIATPQKASA